jgi:hypothetical protein
MTTKKAAKNIPENIPDITSCRALAQSEPAFALRDAPDIANKGFRNPF